MLKRLLLLLTFLLVPAFVLFVGLCFLAIEVFVLLASSRSLLPLPRCVRHPYGSIQSKPAIRMSDWRKVPLHPSCLGILGMFSAVFGRVRRGFKDVVLRDVALRARQGFSLQATIECPPRP